MLYIFFEILHWHEDVEKLKIYNLVCDLST